MLHGRRLTRLRTLIRASLFAMLLGSVAALLALALPARPRWVQPALSLVGITPDGRSVVTMKQPGQASDGFRGNGPLQVWDLQTGQETARYFDDDPFMFTCSFAKCIDKHTLVVPMQRRPDGMPEIQLLDLARGTSRKLPLNLTRHPGNMVTLYVAVAPTFPIAFIHQDVPFKDANEKNSAISVVDLVTGEVLLALDPVELTRSPTFHDHVLFFGYRNEAKTSAVFWDLRTRRLITEADARGEISVAANERVAATTYLVEPNQQKVTLWDLPTGKALSETVTEEGRVVFSEDGNWALIGKQIGDPRKVMQSSFWDLRACRRIGEVRCSLFADWHSVFSDNGQERLLIVSQFDGKVSMLDRETLKPVWERTWPNGLEVELVHWQPQTRRLAVHPLFDNTYEYLDLADGKTVRRVSLAGSRWRNSQGLQANVSRDGRRLSILSEFNDDDTRVINRVLKAVRSLWTPVDERRDLVVLTEIELDTDAVVFQWRGHSTLHSWQFSDDPCTVMIVHGADDREPTLECWDIPAARPWGWIVGAPLVIGVIGATVRWAVVRRGKCPPR